MRHRSVTNNNNFNKVIVQLSIQHWASMCRTRTATVRAVTTRRPVSQNGETYETDQSILQRQEVAEEKTLYTQERWI